MAWEIKNDKLVKELNFWDMRTMASFITQLAILIDAYNHHPDIIISHTKLRLELYTYDEQKISDKDYAMSKMIDHIE